MQKGKGVRADTWGRWVSRDSQQQCQTSSSQILQDELNDVLTYSSALLQQRSFTSCEFIFSLCCFGGRSSVGPMDKLQFVLFFVTPLCLQLQVFLHRRRICEMFTRAPPCLVGLKCLLQLLDDPSRYSSEIHSALVRPATTPRRVWSHASTPSRRRTSQSYWASGGGGRQARD